MTKLWNDLKKNMKDWSSAAVEKAEEVSKIAVAKTEELKLRNINYSANCQLYMKIWVAWLQNMQKMKIW